MDAIPDAARRRGPRGHEGCDDIVQRGARYRADIGCEGDDAPRSRSTGGEAGRGKRRGDILAVLQIATAAAHNGQRPTAGIDPEVERRGGATVAGPIEDRTARFGGHHRRLAAPVAAQHRAHRPVEQPLPRFRRARGGGHRNDRRGSSLRGGESGGKDQQHGRILRAPRDGIKSDGGLAIFLARDRVARRQTPVDRQRLPVDVAGIVGGEEQGDLGQLFRLGAAP